MDGDPDCRADRPLGDAPSHDLLPHHGGTVATGPGSDGASSPAAQARPDPGDCASLPQLETQIVQRLPNAVAAAQRLGHPSRLKHCCVQSIAFMPCSRWNSRIVAL